MNHFFGGKERKILNRYLTLKSLTCKSIKNKNAFTKRKNNIFKFLILKNGFKKIKTICNIRYCIVFIILGSFLQIIYTDGSIVIILTFSNSLRPHTST